MRISSIEKNRVKSQLLLVAALLAAMFFGTSVESFGGDDNNIGSLREMSKAFAQIAKKASPAVVGITTEKMVTRRYSPHQSPFGEQFFEEDFFENFFRRRSPHQRSPHQEGKKESRPSGQGSGFIISTDGYILTNNHVITGADTIKVKLADVKDPVEAELVGTDPASEVAVIKIEAENLTPVEFGDSDSLEVGEWVLAIGNPFGLSHTVTAGIVSAKGRSVGLADYEDFIQTDAAINPGNSGGPLVNLDGKVIGINSAIITRSGGYMGIGLAIPINMAKNVYEQLVESGKVVRGWLGVGIANITPDVAPFFGLAEDTKGVLINQVFEDSAAEKGGLKEGDVVVEFDGIVVDDVDTFRNRVATFKPETKVKMVVLRNKKRRTLTVTLGERPSGGRMAPAGQPDIVEKLGLTVQNLSDDLAKRLGLEGLSGVIVTEVEPGSPAAREGITAGTLIMEVNRKQVKNTREFNKVIEEAEKGVPILLYIQDQYYRRFVAISVPED